MPNPTSVPIFNSLNPAAPSGFQNSKWQTDGGVPIQQITTNVPNTGNVSIKTTSYTLTAADCGTMVVANSSSPITFTLPASPPFAQWQVVLVNIGSGVLTVDPNGLDLDGTLSTIGVTQHQGLSVFTDNTNYFSDRGMGGFVSVGGVDVQTAAYTIVANDAGKIVVYNGSVAATFNLPASPPSSTWGVFVANISSHALTLSPNGLNLDGSASSLLLPPNTGIYVSTDGSNYFTVRGLNYQGGVNVQTIPYTILSTDIAKIVVYNGSIAATFNLPAASPSASWNVFVANISTHLLTLSPNGLNLDGSSSSLLIPPKSGVYISTDGSNYFSVKGLDQQGGVSIQTSTYNLALSDSGKLIVYNSSSAGTFFLPSTPFTPTWRVFIQNIGTGLLTINRNTTQIDGGTTNLILSQGQGIYVSTDGTNHFTSRGAPIQPYHIVSFLPGRPDAGSPSGHTGQVLQWTCPSDLPYGVAFPANFSNSQGFCQIAPTATATYTIYKVTAGSSPGTTGTQIGTIQIATSGVFTFASTSGSAYSFAAGDSMTCWAPSTQDATLAGVGFTLTGTR